MRELLETILEDLVWSGALSEGRARSLIDALGDGAGNVIERLAREGVAVDDVLTAASTATGVPLAPPALLRTPDAAGVDVKALRSVVAVPIGKRRGKLCVAYADPADAVRAADLGLPEHHVFLAPPTHVEKARAKLFGDETLHEGDFGRGVRDSELPTREPETPLPEPGTLASDDELFLPPTDPVLNAGVLHRAEPFGEGAGPPPPSEGFGLPERKGALKSEDRTAIARPGGRPDSRIDTRVDDEDVVSDDATPLARPLADLPLDRVLGATPSTRSTESAPGANDAADEGASAVGDVSVPASREPHDVPPFEGPSAEVSGPTRKVGESPILGAGLVSEDIDDDGFSEPEDDDFAGDTVVADDAAPFRSLEPADELPSLEPLRPEAGASPPPRVVRDPSSSGPFPVSVTIKAPPAQAGDPLSGDTLITDDPSSSSPPRLTRARGVLKTDGAARTHTPAPRVMDLSGFGERSDNFRGSDSELRSWTPDSEEGGAAPGPSRATTGQRRDIHDQPTFLPSEPTPDPASEEGRSADPNETQMDQRRPRSVTLPSEPAAEASVARVEGAAGAEATAVVSSGPPPAPATDESGGRRRGHVAFGEETKKLETPPPLPPKARGAALLVANDLEGSGPIARVLDDIDRYRAEGVLGRGGMATVMLAEDVRVGRKVALKIMASHLARDEKLVERFVREAQKTLSLEHKGVIRALDFGRTKDTYYLVTEYVEGGTVEDLRRKVLTLPSALVVRIMEHTLDGLAYAHSKEMVHRDLKPSNLMISGDGQVKVGDFGIAKGAGEVPLTETGKLFGTLAYMSPEQCAGQELDARSDLYSIGTVFYTLLAGQNPFKHKSPAITATRIAKGEVRPLFEANPLVPPALERVVGRLMAQRREARYQSAAEALADLEPIAKQVTRIFGELIDDSLRDVEANGNVLNQVHAELECAYARELLHRRRPRHKEAAFRLWRAQALDPDHLTAPDDLLELVETHGFNFEMTTPFGKERVGANDASDPGPLLREARAADNKGHLLAAAAGYKRFLARRPLGSDAHKRLNKILGSDPMAPFSPDGPEATGIGPAPMSSDEARRRLLQRPTSGGRK